MGYSNPRGLMAGFAVVGAVGLAVALGSRRLLDYDPALVVYTFGTLIFLFALVYRLVVWLERPPTRRIWRRGLELLLRRPTAAVGVLTRGSFTHLGAQSFLFARSRRRWLAHMLLSWGTLLAVAVTFPLVFGWVHFEAHENDPEVFRAVLFGIRVAEFPLRSVRRYVVFNLLNVSAFMVIAGVVLALNRRLRPSGRPLARQQFGHDLVPLLLLLAISLTGLMLTFSSYALRGYGYAEMSLIHALTVALTLVYLPFGKLFHIFVRPARLAVTLYRQANDAAAPALCGVCGEAYAGALHVADMKEILRQVELDWHLEGPVEHYSHVCPRCRRRLLGASHGRIMGIPDPYGGDG